MLPIIIQKGKAIFSGDMQFSRALSLISLAVLFYCCADVDAGGKANTGIPQFVVPPKPPFVPPNINNSPIKTQQVSVPPVKSVVPSYIPTKPMQFVANIWFERQKKKNNESPINLAPVPKVPERAGLSISLSNRLSNAFSSRQSSTHSGAEVPTDVATTKISGKQQNEKNVNTAPQSPSTPVEKKNEKNVNTAPQTPSTPSAATVATSEPVISASPSEHFAKTLAKGIITNVANTGLSTVVASGVNHGLSKMGVFPPPTSFAINPMTITQNPSTIAEISNQPSSPAIKNETVNNSSIDFKVYIQNLSEDLFKLEENTIKDYIKIDLQQQISNESLPKNVLNQLFTINEDAYKSPIVVTMQKMWANYKNDPTLEEIVTPESTKMEEKLLDLILKTPVMKKTMEFFFISEYLSNDVNEFKNLIRQLWFERFARFPEKGNQGSSGFESIFSYELGNDSLYGFTNWIYCAKHSFKYLGYEKEIKLGKNISALKIRIKKFKKEFPLNILVGTSPELEIALYTICACFYPNEQCPIKLDGFEFNIFTSIYKNGTSKHLKSATISL